MQVPDEGRHNLASQSVPALDIVAEGGVPTKRNATVRQKGLGAGEDLEPWVYTPSSIGWRAHSVQLSIARCHHGCARHSGVTRVHVAPDAAILWTTAPMRWKGGLAHQFSPTQTWASELVASAPGHSHVE